MPRLASCLLLCLLLAAPPALCEEHVLRRAGQELVVDTHLLLFGQREKHVLNWVEHSADALASVLGRWPRDDWRVEVTPVSLMSSDPVPWAQVLRGQPDTVSFYIDALASEETLIKDWTAYHEMSHLLIPYRGWGDMWFSEGLASYYQNLLLARQGIIDDREVWQRLYDGFMRGRADDSRSDLDLATLLPTFRETRSYMRVYWTGVWYYLYLDVQLRTASNNQQSLDSALRSLNRCCRDVRMSAWQMAAKLDQLTGKKLFMPAFHAARASHQVPDFESIFASLGVSVEADSVKLIDDEELREIRDSMAEKTVW